MIFHPSCIGPALCEPFPRYERLGSTPITTVLSFTLSVPNETFEFPSRSGFSSLVDEIPVDICMNQLLAHISSGTTGLVHSAVSAENCLTVGDYRREYISSVLFSERPTIKWIESILRTPAIGQEELLIQPVLRLFSNIGASLHLANGKTGSLGKDGREGEGNIAFEGRWKGGVGVGIEGEEIEDLGGNCDGIQGE